MHTALLEPGVAGPRLLTTHPGVNGNGVEHHVDARVFRQVLVHLPEKVPTSGDVVATEDGAERATLASEEGNLV